MLGLPRLFEGADLGQVIYSPSTKNADGSMLIWGATFSPFEGSILREGRYPPIGRCASNECESEDRG